MISDFLLDFWISPVISDFKSDFWFQVWFLISSVISDFKFDFWFQVWFQLRAYEISEVSGPSRSNTIPRYSIYAHPYGHPINSYHCEGRFCAQRIKRTGYVRYEHLLCINRSVSCPCGHQEFTTCNEWGICPSARIRLATGAFCQAARFCVIVVCMYQPELNIIIIIFIQGLVMHAHALVQLGDLSLSLSLSLSPLTLSRSLSLSLSLSLSHSVSFFLPSSSSPFFLTLSPPPPPLSLSPPPFLSIAHSHFPHSLTRVRLSC